MSSHQQSQAAAYSALENRHFNLNAATFSRAIVIFCNVLHAFHVAN